jgi:hypothetical protein
MPILVSFSDRDGTSAAKIDRFPEACPLCHAQITPRFIAATSRTGHCRQICFQCRSDDCRALFLGTYQEDAPASCRLVGCEPTRPLERAFSPALSEISPCFAQLYNEALSADNAGLTQLTRLGLRAALERLIRDFCKLGNPTESSAIEHFTLSECVERFVTDTKLRTCIERASHELASRGANGGEATLTELLSLTDALGESVLVAK